MTQTPKRLAQVPRHSPSNNDSPSRQLLKELERALNHFQIHETDIHKVRAFHRRSFIQDLDAHDLARTQADIALLDAATAKHEAIRRQAEDELQRHRQELEETERRKREEEARLAREKAAREKAERERKEREEAERKAKFERERVAKERKAAEEKANAEADAKHKKEGEEAAAKAKLDKEQAEKAEADKAAAERQKAQRQAQPKSTSTAQPTASGYLSLEFETLHKQYISIHRKLKDFRTSFLATLKRDERLRELKSKASEMRRGIRMSVGQLTDDRTKNKIANDRVRAFVMQSLQHVSSPPEPLSPYLTTTLADPNTTIPSLTLYVLTIFSKAVVSAFAGECAVNPRAAEPIGTLVAQIFALHDLQYPLAQQSSTSDTPKTTSLIPILLCKLLTSAPHLLSLSQPTPYASSAQKLRMGHRLESETNTAGSAKSLIPPSRQLDRLSGLGAGYTSISLRNFSRSKMINPYPPRLFWTALTGLLTTPAPNIEVGHVALVKAMLETGYERIMLFWGNAGVALLREAGIHWPARLIADPKIRVKEGIAAAVKGMEVMIENWERENHFDLKTGP